MKKSFWQMVKEDRSLWLAGFIFIIPFTLFNRICHYFGFDCSSKVAQLIPFTISLITHIIWNWFAYSHKLKKPTIIEIDNLSAISSEINSIKSPINENPIEVKSAEISTNENLAGINTVESSASVNEDTIDSYFESYGRLNRKTQIKHLRSMFSWNSWRWFLSNLVYCLLLPVFKPLDLFSKTSMKEVEAVSYSWFLLSILCSIILYLLSYIIDILYILFLPITALFFAISLYPITLASEVRKYEATHSFENICMIMAIIACIGIYEGSFVAAMIFFGMLIGNTLPVMNIEKGAFGYTILGGLLLLVIIGTYLDSYLTPSWLNFAYFIVSISFFLGNILKYCFGSNAINRYMGFVITWLLSTILASVVLVASISVLSRIDKMIFMVSMLLSFSAFINGKLFSHYRDSKDKPTHFFHMLSHVPIKTAIFPVIAFWTVISFILFTKVQKYVIHQYILGWGASIAALPFFTYGVPFYLFVSLIFSFQWGGTKWHLKRHQKTKILSLWKNSIACRVQCLQLPLPFFPSFLLEIANRHGLIVALAELDKYAKVSMEGKSVIRFLRTLTREGYSVYTMFSWAFSRNLVPQLILIGKKYPVMRAAVRLLVVLDFLPEDPYQTKVALKIRSKGRLYTIEDSHHATKESLINGAFKTLKEHATQEDLVYFSKILQVLENAQKAKWVGGLQDAVEALADFVVLSTNLHYAEEHHDWLVQIANDLKERISHYPLNSPERLRGKDREWLYDQLHWFEMHKSEAKKSLVGMLILFVLNRIKQIQA